MAGGGTYTTTLPVTGSEYAIIRSIFGVLLSWQIASALRDVAEFLAAQTMAVSVESVGFSTTFPR